MEIPAARQEYLEQLKRSAKRLQKLAPELIGHDLSLSVCQEIAARMAGARSFHEAVTFLSVGPERDTGKTRRFRRG